MIKKNIIILALVSISYSVLAQNESDALRFSQNYAGGTARNLAMGGAFGALGGDASSLYINPAGIGVYRSSEFSFTSGVNYDNVMSKYLGTSYEDYKYKFNVSNLSYIYSFNTNNNTGWVGASFGIAYNRLSDFNRNMTIIGNNAQSSMLDEFVYNSNNGTANKYYEDLAWYTDVLLYDSIAKVYSSDFTRDGYGQSQKHSVVTKGGIGEYDLSFGANYSNMLYLGATIGIQRVDYEETKYHTETDVNNTIGYLKSFNFNENFNAYGYGFNFKFGAIFRPVNLLRLGLAFHTPTFYKIDSEFYTTMDTHFDVGNPLDMSERSDLLSSTYNLTTPMKVIGSVALQLDKYGLISFDYEMLDYTKSRFRSDQDDFSDINSNMKEVYKRTSNIKVGAEGKLGPFALRLGYGYYGNPYTSDQFNSNYSYQSYTTGFGIRGKSVFFDVAYVLSKSKEKTKLYVYERGNTLYSQLADLDISRTKVMATLGFRF